MNAAMTRTNTPQAVGVPTIRKFRIVQTEGNVIFLDYAEEEAVKQLTETAKKLPADKKKGGKA